LCLLILEVLYNQHTMQKKGMADMSGCLVPID